MKPDRAVVEAVELQEWIFQQKKLGRSYRAIASECDLSHMGVKWHLKRYCKRCNLDFHGMPKVSSGPKPHAYK